jgi:hypothetical protein
MKHDYGWKDRYDLPNKGRFKILTAPVLMLLKVKLYELKIICPIYKGKGSSQEPENYTRISLLSVFGKDIFRDFSRQTEELVVEP